MVPSVIEFRETEDRMEGQEYGEGIMALGFNGDRVWFYKKGSYGLW